MRNAVWFLRLSKGKKSLPLRSECKLLAPKMEPGAAANCAVFRSGALLAARSFYATLKLGSARVFAFSTSAGHVLTLGFCFVEGFRMEQ